MSRKIWVPVAVALLVAMFVGPGGVTATEPRLTTASIMIPASAFHPTSDDVDYKNEAYLKANSATGVNGYFQAPLVFPVPVVNIKRITLYAYDRISNGQACLQLRRSRPPLHETLTAGQVCTGSTSSGAVTVFTTDISPRRVDTANAAAYLWVSVTGTGATDDVAVRGVRVTYSY